jgi:hypothetical protein
MKLFIGLRYRVEVILPAYLGLACLPTVDEGVTLTGTEARHPR